MKFRAERTEFADAAAWVMRTLPPRELMPGLSSVHLEVHGDRLRLRSTDLEISSDLEIPVQGDRDGTALVRGRLLGDVVRSLPPAAVSAETDGDLLRLSCGRAHFDLRMTPADDYPPPRPAADQAPTAVMKAETFSAMVGQVARAASTDDNRPVLTGVHLDADGGELTATATDSYRLAVRTIEWDQDLTATVLVPRRALEEARRSADQVGGEVRLTLEPDAVTFEVGDRRLVTRLLEGRYPDVHQLVPGGFERRLDVDRAELIEVVRRVSVVGETASVATPVKLHLSSEAVRVTAGTGEVGQAEESLPGTLEGEELTIAFNPRYLADGLDAAGGERVSLEFRDELKPAVIRPVGDADERFLYLLMPVRL